MPEARLPPVRWIATTLRTTTERLVRELHEPGTSAPDWDEREWKVAHAAAAMHGIAPLLASRLTWRGPDTWCDFLSQQREHTQRRHLRIADLLARLDAAARTRGLALVALKGAALHDLDIYRPGERPMSDVDLLVSPRDRIEAIRMIESLDYEFVCEVWKHVVFRPRGGEAMARIGEHADNPIKIELHMKIAEQLPLATCDISDMIFPLRQSSGLAHYRTRSALMAHVLLHAAGCFAAHGMRALNMHDIARLSPTMSAGDWQDLLALSNTDRLWWVYPPLALVARYFPGTIPDEVIEFASTACSWGLRQSGTRRALTDVSLSDPRIRAFPGIEWSRSFAQALEYAAVRIRPKREIIALREQYEEWQSLGADDPWVRSTQLARVARWLRGGATRVETMASVRAAFAD